MTYLEDQSVINFHKIGCFYDGGLSELWAQHLKTVWGAGILNGLQMSVANVILEGGLYTLLTTQEETVIAFEMFSTEITIGPCINKFMNLLNR